MTAPVDRVALGRAVAWTSSWLDWRMATVDLPGLSVAISHRGRLLLDRAWGVADVETGARLRADHVFRVASHSKTFTAAAVLQLAEQGALHLDDPVSRHLPWLDRHQDPRVPAVTLRQLLSHGAGVIRDGLDTDHWQLGRAFPDEARFRRDVLASGLVLEPNVRLKYSNVGYTLLGLVVAAAAGRPYKEVVTERLVRPLGLERTSPELPGPRVRQVTGHGRPLAGPDRAERIRLPVAPVDTRSMSAATGFASTASDLCAWFTALLPGSGKVLSDASKREMQRVHWHAYQPGGGPHRDYGLGVERETIGDRTVLGHGGGFPGQITRSTVDPESGIAVVALTNAVDGPAADVVRGIWGAISWFQAHGGHPGAAARRIEGRYAEMWGVTDLVATDAGAVLVEPDSWDPWTSLTTLERVDAARLRITDTGSFGSEGEEVQVRTGRRGVTGLRVAGASMWPEAVWRARQRRAAAERNDRPPTTG